MWGLSKNKKSGKGPKGSKSFLFLAKRIPQTGWLQ